jgi:hypothetical protein
MNKYHSIADASAILHGANRITAQANTLSKTPITLSKTLGATLRNDEYGKRLCKAIVSLGEREILSEIPASPPFRQCTSRVLETRDGKLNVASAIHVATLATAEHLEEACSGNENVQHLLTSAYVEALRAIDTMRGRAFDLGLARDQLYTETFRTATNEEARTFASELLREAEKSYLAEEQAALFQTVKPVSHSDDFEMKI